ncbi:MAG: LicD family protein [Erysipelotrichaceae bacterium]|nr:LicD family protein [Erysipelotrichaceae bacterium]
MQADLKKQQEILLEILKAIIDVCKRNGITYYCQAGTVLGAIRHKGFIPWDNDADIIIPNDQIDFFVECARKQLPETYFVDYFKGDDHSFRLFPRVGLRNVKTKSLHVDVFRLIGLPDDREEQLAMIEEARSYTKENKQVRAPMYKMLLKRKFRYLYERLTDKKKYDRLFDELCSRYPYQEATYVMNPSGKYGAKNIFDKKVYGKGQSVPFEDTEAVIPSEVDFYLKQYYGDYMKFPPQEEIDRLMAKVVEI